MAILVAFIVAGVICVVVVVAASRKSSQQHQKRQEEPATEEQIEYIKILLKKTGKMGHHVSGPTAKLSLYELSKQEASFLIDYLKGDLYFEDDEK